MSDNNSHLDYYKSQSRFTDPGKFAHLFENLPTSIKELVKMVQGIVIDKDLIELYGETLSDEQKNDTESRYVEKILEIVTKRNNSPLSVERAPKERVLGSCRDYAIVLCSMLRHINIPARLRCGYADYFNTGRNFFEDHWVCEYWKSKEKRWVLVDANVDDMVKQKYHVVVDIFDVPRDHFIVAGEAWILCRSGKSDPNNFGVSGFGSGFWLIRGNVVRDLATLNKIEMLPWDVWGIMDKGPNDFSPREEWKLLDKVAQTIAGDIQLNKIKSMYRNNKSLQVPSQIKSYTPFGGLKFVKIEN